MSNLKNVIYYIAYAGGFAMGNYIGIYIEERMAIGTVVIRIITQKEATDLVERLKYDGYGVTHIDTRGTLGPVKIVFTIIKRRDVNRVIDIIRKFNPTAFFTIEDIRSVRKGIFRKKRELKKSFISRLKKKRQHHD